MLVRLISTITSNFNRTKSAIGNRAKPFWFRPQKKQNRTFYVLPHRPKSKLGLIFFISEETKRYAKSTTCTTGSKKSFSTMAPGKTAPKSLIEKVSQ